MAVRVMPKRRAQRTSYRELADVKIPRMRRYKRCVTNDETLYSIEIVQRKGTRVKIHYVGYSSSHDEWRDEKDVVVCTNNHEETASVSPRTSKKAETVQPFSLHFELGHKIKQMLTCSRKASPLVLITMPFDLSLFNGGLKAAGKPSKTVNGNQRYTLARYQDVAHLLGEDWHFRGLNINGDYAYVELKTVEFYLQKRHQMVEYFPTTNGSMVMKGSYNLGKASYVLKFKFVRNYGTLSTFGKDNTIFYNNA